MELLQGMALQGGGCWGPMHGSPGEQQRGQAALGVWGGTFLPIALAGRRGSSGPAGAAGREQLPICRKFRKHFGFRPVWTETKRREKSAENSRRPNSPGPTGAERPQRPAAPAGPGSAAGAPQNLGDHQAPRAVPQGPMS